MFLTFGGISAVKSCQKTVELMITFETKVTMSNCHRDVKHVADIAVKHELC